MDRDWNDFKSLHGNLAGAREAFEDACEILFKKVYKGYSVSQVKVKHGDGGIDIFIGELGIEPITVIQCKFFLNSFSNSQKSQIRRSFNDANTDSRYSLRQWILCLPRAIDIDEHSWWFKWKSGVLKTQSKGIEFISLLNGNELIGLFKEHGLYNQVFKIEDSMKIDTIYRKLVGSKEAETCSRDIRPQQILFNNYSKPVEPYYFERQVDKELVKSLKINNVWVYGASGSGKTTLVNRNLVQSCFDYCYCDLSPIDVLSSDEVMLEVLCKVEEKFDIERNRSQQNIIKQIDQILSRANKRAVYIVIDELSVYDRTILKQIAERLMMLVNYFCNQNCEGELKFIFSTIFDPRLILDNRSKAMSYFQYIDCTDWSNDIEDLFNVLSVALHIDLAAFKSIIITEVGKSPRILKSFFRKIIIADGITKVTVRESIDLTISEFIS